MRVVKISECAIILISIIVAIFSYNHLENSYIKNRQKEISHYEYDELNRKLDDNPSIVIPLEVFKDEPYFGGNGYVAHAWKTNADNGTNINAYGLQAFNSFNGAGTLKRFTMSRPILRADGTPAIYAGIDVDFNLNDLSAPLTTTPISYA